MVEPVENPETGEKVYPFWDADGYPLDANGNRAHRCVGNATECITPAVCEVCGKVATPETPVNVCSEVTDDGPQLDFFCDAHAER